MCPLTLQVSKSFDSALIPQSLIWNFSALSSGISLQLPHEVPEGVEAVVFKLKPDVSLEWLLQLADTLQGLPGLEGESFQGLLVRPDVYYVRSASTRHNLLRQKDVPIVRFPA